MIYLAFASAFVVMLVSLVGSIFARNRVGAWMEKNLRYLATFAIGVFVVIAWSLSVEAVEHAGYIKAALAALAGAALVAIAAHLIPGAHHHHGREDHGHSRIDARRMMASDAMHNITDGLLLVPAYLASPVAGVIATVAILAHELVQETAEFFVLKEAGYSTREALRNNFIVSSTILIGVSAAALLSSVEGAEALLIAFSAGGFLHILVRDLVPNSIKSVRMHGKAYVHIAAAVVGAVAMIAISLAAPHAHEEHGAPEDTYARGETHTDDVAGI